MYVLPGHNQQEIQNLDTSRTRVSLCGEFWKEAWGRGGVLTSPGFFFLELQQPCQHLPEK